MQGIANRDTGLTLNRAMCVDAPSDRGSLQSHFAAGSRERRFCEPAPSTEHYSALSFHAYQRESGKMTWYRPHLSPSGWGLFFLVPVFSSERSSNPTLCIQSPLTDVREAA